MLSNLFHTHGLFCASHPWEIIIGTITITTCLLSVSLFTAGTRICGWNYVCEKEKVEEGSDLMLLSVTRCLAVMYLYLQFRNIRQLGSKYLLGISGSLTIFSSFVFTVVIVKVFSSDLSGLNEAIPFFLLLVDLSKACALAKYALKSKTQEEVQKNIAEGMAVIGPVITLDSICEALVIGVGTLSGVKQLDSMCCYGCLSVVAHYLSFMIFYPACLSLILEITRARNHGKPLLQLQQLSSVLEKEEEKKPNPVTQHIKMIMSAGLMIVHIHSRLVTIEGENTAFTTLLPATELLEKHIQPEMTLIQFYILRLLTHHVDYTFMFVLAVFLTLKYIFFDDHIEEELHRKLEEAKQTRIRQISNSLRDNTTQTTDELDTCNITKLQDDIDFRRGKSVVSFTTANPEIVPCKFSIGDSSVSEEEDEETSICMVTGDCDVGIQTDSRMSQRLPSQKKTRPLTECVQILNSDLKYTLDVEVINFDPQITDLTSLNGILSFGLATEENDIYCKYRQSTEEERTLKKLKLSELDTKLHREKEHNRYKVILLPRKLVIIYIGTHHTVYLSAKDKDLSSIVRELVLAKTYQRQKLYQQNGLSLLTDEEIINLVESGWISAYKLETMLKDFKRGVAIRRKMLLSTLTNVKALDNLPYAGYDYEIVNGACCENVIGYMPLPVGVAGPLLLDNQYYQVPMATTEGCLVASTNRGCKALEQSGGVSSVVVNDGMTRGPVVRFSSAKRASEIKKWLEDLDNLDKVKKSFNMTSRFARLKNLHVGQAGKLLFIRFVAVTGDAMGMNMLSKGAEKALEMLSTEFTDMEILSLSGNFCTDKKSSSLNWLEGRGKSVVCEAVIPGTVVQKLLKTSVQALVDLNVSKNLVGSAMAGSIGGFNAHAANIVTAIFIATGQDPAQNVTSSYCITLMEATGEDNSDLLISCTMPCIEVGTIGGGTVLPPQAACLEMLGVRGSCSENPGDNAKRLASIVCGTVLAGELSLMSALATGHLVRSHLKHNRSTLNVMSSQNLPESSSSQKLENSLGYTEKVSEANNTGSSLKDCNNTPIQCNNSQKHCSNLQEQCNNSRQICDFSRTTTNSGKLTPEKDSSNDKIS